jgi:hypothetical protein
MRGFRRVTTLLAALFVAAACADLTVENLNDPERERAITTPEDVETLISGQYYTWWYTQASSNSYGMMTSVMADQHSSSWGNYDMRATSEEPRNAFINDPSYTYATNHQRAWYRAYRAISTVRDGLIAIAGADGALGTSDDLQIGTDGQDTQRAITFARFIQGMAHSVLGLMYDQAFIVDETTDLQAGVDRVPYDQVIDASIGYLEEAITLAGQGSFNIPPSWMGQAIVDNQRLIRLCHFYIAQFMAYSPRTVAERDAVNWSAVDGVLYHANNGIIEDYVMIADNETWWNTYMRQSQRSGWSATDLREVGPSDQLGGWDAWEKTTAGLRQAFDIDADDLRMPMYPPVIGGTYDCWGQPTRDFSCGAPGLRMVMEYRGPAQAGFRPERGTYHFSGYYGIPNYGYFDDRLGPMDAHVVFEQDMLKAEAYIRLGQEANALPLINATRVTYGGLAPVTGAGKVPFDDAPTNTRCTPRMITNFPDGNWECGDLWEALKWEKRLETYGTTTALAYYDDRGWGNLVSGTGTMLPVPGQELLLLLEDIYTYGGEPGEVGSAPDIVRWEDGGLRPLRLGEVPTAADMRARVEFFQSASMRDIAKELGDPLRR